MQQATLTKMQSFGYVTLFVVLTTGLLIHYHHEVHGVVNLAQAGLGLFCSINLLICIWEIGLYVNRRLIREQYLEMKSKLKGALPKPMFMFEEVSLRQALTLKHWAKVWSTYSLMDPSYSDQTTWG